MEKQTKTVTLSDVYAVVDAAPLKILLKIKERLDARVDTLQSSDNERGVARALMFNGQLADEGEMPNLGEAVMPSSPLPSQNSSTGAPPSIRSMLGAMMGSSGEDLPDTSSLRQQLEKLETTGPPRSELMELDIVFLYNDNYNNGLAAVKDDQQRKEIERMNGDAKNKGWHFPYGYGNNKDLLKVKGLKGTRKGAQMKITVHFKQYNFQGKQGYSCYFKK